MFGTLHFLFWKSLCICHMTFLKLNECFVFQFFTSPLQQIYITSIPVFIYVLSAFVLKSSCSNSHENCLKIVCFVCVFVRRSSIEHIFQLFYSMKTLYFSTNKPGHFIIFLPLTNCSPCNPKVHNNKKIRLFSFFFTQVGNGKIVFIGWTL